MAKADKKMLHSAFVEKLKTVLKEPGTALVLVNGEDDDGSPTYREGSDVLDLLTNKEPGTYHLVRQEDEGVTVLSRCTINEEGERVTKKDKQRQNMTAAPLESGGARVLSFANEVYSGIAARAEREVDRLTKRLEKVEAQRDSYWQTIQEAEAENPTENLMNLALTAFNAWQAKGFKSQGADFCRRVLVSFQAEPELQKRIAEIMMTELQNEASALLLGAKTEESEAAS